MRGYAKYRANKTLSQRSGSKSEYPFLDKDFDTVVDISTSSETGKNDQNPVISQDDKNKKNDVFIGKKFSQEFDDDVHLQEAVKNEESRRNYSVSSSTTPSRAQINGKNEHLDRQSSTRSIQDAVKKAFSMKRSVSENNSDRYCRIYDQHKKGKDSDYDLVRNVYDYDYGDNGRFNHYRFYDDDGDDYEFESNGSTETETGYLGLQKKKKNDNGKKKGNSKVVKAFKRLFSR